jgi:pimeloyl-ACP methyl ester carboxylesterase
VAVADEKTGDAFVVEVLAGERAMDVFHHPLHGSHGSRADTVDHLRMLSRAGYGVLAYDARGHGASAGQTNALGWRGADDIAGAVAFLRHQPDVDGGRIAALGLSMGAEETLRAAAGGVPLRAVVADGAGASTAGDERIVSGGAIARSVTWMTMRATELLSGDAEPAPLQAVAHAIRVPVLLIASRRAGERRIDEAYRSRIGASASLWYVADADHTRALRAHPSAYATRVVGFLDAALGSPRATS